MNWPLFFKDNLIVGDPKSQVGICTLWTDKNYIIKNIPQEKFGLCGNLYTVEGINYIIKNILANPFIKYIILSGADLMKSGDALINFIEKGTDEQRKIINSYGFISRAIDDELLENFRKNVKVIDLRGKQKEVLDEVEKLQQKNPRPFTKPVLLKEEKGGLPELYAEEQGFVLRGENISGVWFQILNLIMKFGEEKESEYKLKQKEILNLVSVIEGGEKTENLCSLRIEKKDLENYYDKFFGDPKKYGVHYTYGDRLKNYPTNGKNFDQIKRVVEYLTQTPHTRRAQAITWNVKLDNSASSPPCLTQLNWLIKYGKLYQTAIIRSNDMFGSWPLNVLVLKKLQNEIAKEINIISGSLTTISVSAHIYENNFEEALRIIETNVENKILPFKKDKTGYFIIRIEDGEIIARHHLIDGRKSGIVFNSGGGAKKAEYLYRRILNENLISLLDHAAYLGHELARAEECLKTDKPFVQDKA